MITSRKSTIFQYIESKVNIENDCWNWLGSKDKDGYGKACFSMVKQRAHRLAYKVYIGDIPDKGLICHTCVNPSHLFLGTTLSNMQDKVKKGRQLRGIALPYSKLSEEDVLNIRMLRPIKTLKELSTIFNCSIGNLSDICRGNTWTHL